MHVHTRMQAHTYSGTDFSSPVDALGQGAQTLIRPCMARELSLSLGTRLHRIERRESPEDRLRSLSKDKGTFDPDLSQAPTLCWASCECVQESF